MKYLSSISSDNCDVTFVNGTFTSNVNLSNGSNGFATEYYERVIGDGGNVESLFSVADAFNDRGNLFAVGSVFANGIYSTSNGYVGGNLGVGTVNPLYKLDVDGSVRFTGDLTVDTNTLYVDSTNNRVGIGTTSPGRKFHLAHSDSNNGLLLEHTSQASSYSILQNIRQNEGLIWQRWINGFFNSNLITLSYDGDLGIGTTSPDQKLQIHESTSSGAYLKVTNSTTGEDGGNGSLFGISSNEEALVWNYENTATRFGTNGTERMRITSSGNVGIGTTAPSDLFHIKSTTTDARAILDGATGFDAELKFFENGTAKYTIGHDAASNNFVIGTTNVDTNQRLVISSTGNVGIGTTNPTVKLHIQGTENVDDTKLYLTENANNLGAYFKYNGATNQGIIGGLTTGAENPVITFSRDSSTFNITTSGTSAIYVNSSQNVGIGTTSPDQKLQIHESTGSTGAYLKVTNFTTGEDGGNGSLFGISSNGEALVWNYENTATRFGTNGTERMRITSTGNVGIGTTSPGQNLEISGQGNVTIRLTSTDNTTSTLQFADSDDANVGMIQYNHSDNHMFFRTNADERMRISSSGNVGIGTTSPAQKLDVSGNIKLSGYIVDSNNEIIDFAVNDLKVQGKHVNAEFGVWARSYGSTRQMGIDGGASYMGLYTSGTEKMRIDSSGNVGIGTTSPGEKLDVVGASGADTYGRFLGGAGGTKGGIILGNNDAGKNYGRLYFDNSNNNLYLYQEYSTGNLILGTNTTERMRITSAGNVGIGTTSPSSNLHVVGNDTGILELTRNSGTPHIFFKNTSNTGYGRIYVSDNAFQISAGTSTKALDFAWIQGDSNGNVGIGTTSPAFALDVYNTGAATARIRITGTSNYSLFQSANSSGALYLGIDNSTGNGFNQGAYSRLLYSSGAYPLVISTNSAERMRITSSGNVGIGTTSPGQKLTVNGSIGITTSNRLFVNDIAAYTGSITLGPTGTSDLIFRTTDIERMRIKQGGNVLIGNTTDSGEILQVYGDEKVTGYLHVDGDVGIGNDAPAYKLDVSGDINSDGDFYQNGVQGATGTVNLALAGGGSVTLEINGGIITSIV